MWSGDGLVLTLAPVGKYSFASEPAATFNNPDTRNDTNKKKAKPYSDCNPRIPAHDPPKTAAISRLPIQWWDAVAAVDENVTTHRWRWKGNVSAHPSEPYVYDRPHIPSYIPAFGALQPALLNTKGGRQGTPHGTAHPPPLLVRCKTKNQQYQTNVPVVDSHHVPLHIAIIVNRSWLSSRCAHVASKMEMRVVWLTE
jgi:hypothetical protein